MHRGRVLLMVFFACALTARSAAATSLLDASAWEVTFHATFIPTDPCHTFLQPGDPCQPLGLVGTVALWEQFSVDTLPVTVGAEQAIPLLLEGGVLDFVWRTPPNPIIPPDPIVPPDPITPPSPIRLFFTFGGSLVEATMPSPPPIFPAFAYSSAQLNADTELTPSPPPIVPLDGQGFASGKLIVFDAPVQVGDFTVSVTAVDPVPEPSSLLLLSTGIAAITRWRGRRQR